MRRFSILELGPAIVVAVGACSLLNAPDDIIPGTGGGTSTTQSSTSSASTSSGTGGSGGCVVDEDCPLPDKPCQKRSCGPDKMCTVIAEVDATPCDDGLFCTEGDACTGGECKGAPRACPAKDACNPGACDEASKACVTAAGNEGGTCDAGDPCFEQGTCKAGVCQKGADACKKLATDCIDATCTPQGCVTANKLDGTGCGMSFCSNGTCKSGHCNIVPINEGKTCDDGLFCTVNDTCKSGFCVGAPNPCPTGAGCIKGTCDEASKSCVMEPIPDNSPCDDGDACTANEFCSNQQCTGGLPPTTLFSETFANNNQGWTLGTEWQIGFAQTSFGQSFGYPDPSFDVTGEGKVAGVQIGGNAVVAFPDPTHAPFYLTSPPVNTMFAGSIYLTFYRWLNSDYTPYMKNVIEVTADGSTWNKVWESADVPITDGKWTFQAIDITAYKSASTRFRFGFSIGSSDVYSVSSWNLDKVKVQNAPCPN